MESQALLAKPSSIHRDRERDKGRQSTISLALGLGALCCCALLLALFARHGSVPTLRTLGAPPPPLPSFVSAGAVWENGRFRLVNASDPAALAVANYSRNVNGNGWNHLSGAVLADRLSDRDPGSFFKSMEALGFLEGYLSCNEMQQYYRNFYSGLFDGADPSEETLRFLSDNYAWVRGEAEARHSSSEYWFAVRGVLAQVEGMLHGLVEGCAISEGDKRRAQRSDVTGLEYLSSLDRPALLNVLLVNANGDLYQIADKFKDFDSDSFNKRRDDDYHQKKGKSGTGIARRRLSPRAQRRKRRADHCSALIKVLPGYTDVVFGHSTWDDFQTLGPRTVKQYSLPVIQGGHRVQLQDMSAYATYSVHFSSSPALLSSVDDFYLTHRAINATNVASLAIMETTIDVYTTHLLELVEPNTMLSWMRARIASQLASSGREWAEIFSRHHSGTYVNQWMVLDLALFTVGQPPPSGFLYILEEIPGLVHFEDMTSHLTRSDGYWASYNEPYFIDISVESGNAAECARNTDSCFVSDPRANIFRAHQSGVHSIDDLKLLLGYNQFQIDPLSKGDPCNAIACRSDLDPSRANRYPFGATDAKVSSALMATRPVPEMQARLGPTTDNQTPFCWSDFDKSSAIGAKNNRQDRVFSHEGQPDCFNYTWEAFPPRRNAI